MSDLPSPKPARAAFAVHVAVYLVLSCILAYVLVDRYARPLRLEEHIPAEPQLVAQVEQRIDPNVANWAELARLPGVGELLAKRIVAYRDERADKGPVFHEPEDLQAISGIGPKKIEGMRPSLRFPGLTAPETREVQR